MIEVKTIGVDGFEGAILGMRNPKKSRDKSDSNFEGYNPYIGKKDLKLAQMLIKANKEAIAAGNPHNKYLRMIHVQADINAPLYWWKEMDQYKVSTTTDSESTMHTIHQREFTLDDFAHDQLIPNTLAILKNGIISTLNICREGYLQAVEDKDPEAKNIWYQIIQLLPSSYMQKRTWDANYQVLRDIYFYRRNHKLDEWHVFCAWIETLPYAEELIMYDPKEGSKNETAEG